MATKARARPRETPHFHTTHCSGERVPARGVGLRVEHPPDQRDKATGIHVEDAAHLGDLVLELGGISACAHTSIVSEQTFGRKAHLT